MAYRKLSCKVKESIPHGMKRFLGVYFNEHMQGKSLTRLATIVSFVLLIFVFLPLYHLSMRPNILVDKPSRQLHIPHGTSLRQLSHTLQQCQYVSNPYTFFLLARCLRYDRKILPGAYQLTTNMSNWEALQLLRTGKQQPVKIILHRACNKAMLAANITRSLAMSAADFAALLDDTTFLDQYGFHSENVLTMFIPNTYEVYWTVRPKALFERMYIEYKRFWNSDRRKQAKILQLTPVEVSILASMVQGETNKLEEAPIIAGVYLNRLRRNMALQSCPTLLYALGNLSKKRVLHQDKQFDSPYNTYKYRGLPPGPIQLPTIAMIDAVLNHTHSPYLYFSAKEDLSGYHYFSKSLDEHIRHAGRYHKALNKARIYR